jgi:hypothetical protein
LCKKTTAGTVGALAVKEASLVLCAGFVVAEATARLLRTREGDSATFVVTGVDRFPLGMVATSEGSLMVLRPRVTP